MKHKIVISYNKESSEIPRTVVLLETYSEYEEVTEQEILWSSKDYTEVDIDTGGLTK